MLMQNFGATIKKHYGMLWYFLEWPILLTKTGIEYLESGIRDVESRIPGYLGLPYMGRLIGRLVELLLFDPNTLHDTMFSF